MKVPCEICGKEIERSPTGLRLYAHQYCSQECQHKSMLVDKSKKLPDTSWKENWHRVKPSRHGAMITLRCDHCGEPFSRDEYAIKRYKKHYCSRRCHHLAAAKHPRK